MNQKKEQVAEKIVHFTKSSQKIFKSAVVSIFPDFKPIVGLKKLWD
jgi:hypothetical protein